MERNVGNIDKMIRVIAGATIIAFGAYYNSWWGALGAIPIITAAVGICPLYIPFGINTWRRGGGPGCCCR